MENVPTNISPAEYYFWLTLCNLFFTATVAFVFIIFYRRMVNKLHHLQAETDELQKHVVGVFSTVQETQQVLPITIPIVQEVKKKTNRAKGKTK